MNTSTVQGGCFMNSAMKFMKVHEARGECS